jgi:sulfate adenylyltransferase
MSVQAGNSTNSASIALTYKRSTVSSPHVALHCCCRVFPCATPAHVRADLPSDTDVVAFQCRNPVHRAHYELFTRALHAPNVRPGAVCLVHPTCGPTQVCGFCFFVTLL